MQIAVVWFVQVLIYLPQRFLPPTQYNEGSWDFHGGIHSIEKNIIQSKKISREKYTEHTVNSFQWNYYWSNSPY